MSRPHELRRRSAAEWTSLGLSVLILLAVLAPLVYEYVMGGTEPPLITVQPHLDQVQQGGGGYYLPVTIHNEGDQTAEDVSVRLRLARGAGEPEAIEIELRVLAGGAVAEAVAVFSGDPAAGTLSHTISFFRP